MKTIIMADLDPGFAEELAEKPGGVNLRKCYACGTCTAGCPVFQVDSDYNPRRLLRMILLGMRKEVLSSRALWLCSRCYTCTSTCPQGVDLSDIMMALRDMAVAAGYASAETRERIDAISAAAHELRRDCINLLLGVGSVTEEDIRSRAERAVALARGEKA